LVDFRVMIPASFPLPGFITRRLPDLRVMIPGNRQTSHKRKYVFQVTIPGNRQFPEIVAQKSTDIKKYQINFWVMIPGNHLFMCIITRRLVDLRVTIPSNWSIARSFYPEIAMKKTFFMNNFAKTKKLWKGFVGLLKGLGTIDSWKNRHHPMLLSL